MFTFPVTLYSSGGGPPPAYVTQFLNRATGTTNNIPYITLIEGLFSDGVWQLLDALYLYATDQTANAVLNLVSSNFTTTVNGSPTFTANQGYSGNSNTTDYLNTGFNPATATTPNFTENSASFGCFTSTSDTGNNAYMGNGNSSGCSNMYPIYSGDGNFYARVNEPSVSSVGTIANIQGFNVANRQSATKIQGYHNGVQVGSDASSNAGSPVSTNFAVMGINPGASGSYIAGITFASAFIGAGLTSTQVLALYNRIHTYLQAV